MQVNVHPTGYRSTYYPPVSQGGEFVAFHVLDSGALVTVYLSSVEQADELIAAVSEARAKLTPAEVAA